VISMSPKQRICDNLIDSAKIYQSVFMDYDYLIYSNHFTIVPYYIISGIEGNFAHLTGVKPLIPARDFYLACLDSTLRETDFEYRNEKSVKGTVKRKLKSFFELPRFFCRDLKAEENFSKGNILCTVGTADNLITVGFIQLPHVRPMTLLKGNRLDPLKAVDITLVLRRDKGSKEFNAVIQGGPGDMLSLLNKLMN